MSAPPAYDDKNQEAMMGTPGGYGGAHSYPNPSGFQQGSPQFSQSQFAQPQCSMAPQTGSFQQNVTVQIQQAESQGNNRQNLRDWNSGLCSCCDDVGGCCLTMFCPQIMMCRLASRLGESACCVGFCCEQFGSLSHMRVKLRTLYGIRGDICDDICTRWRTPNLLMCQMDRELKHLGL